MKATRVPQDIPMLSARPTHHRTFRRFWYVLTLSFALAGFAEAQEFLYETNGAVLTITGYTGPGGTITIPSTIEGKVVASIGDYAFTTNVALTGVNIPNSVTNIGYSAFEGCAGLTTLMIPPSVARLGYWAFAGCDGLTRVEVPSGLSSVGNYVFALCDGLETVEVNGNEFGTGMFWHCTNLLNVTIGNTVKNIDGFIFGDCARLANVVIPNGVESIGGSAFQNCTGLERLVLPSSITNIDDSAFIGCTALSSIYFLGDAPIIAPFSFSDLPEGATIYWMPGTSGWPSDIDGIPTVLWNPHVDGSAYFGVAGGVFSFTISGSSNLVIVTEASTNLLDALWLAVSTNVLVNGSSTLQDPGWSDHKGRFYRFRAP